jgi:hypothetical protein
VLAVVLLAAQVCGAGAGSAAPGFAPPSGRADVFTSPETLANLDTSVGTTFTLEVRVEPNRVGVDAAAARVQYDAAYLEVAESGIVPGPLFETEIIRSVNPNAGTLFYAAGTVTKVRPETTFVLVQITFRL